MTKKTLLIGLFLSISTSSFLRPDQLKLNTRLAVPTIQLELVPTGVLTSPVLVTNAHDGTNRLFIVEQAGRIRVQQPGGATLPTLFLNITSRVSSGGERGLLGLAFHPNYAANRRFFVYYTRTGDGTIVLAEYLVSSSNPNVAETTEKVILTITHPASNHNGGTIEFGPDNFLYIATGDGGIAPGPGNPAQNKDDIQGKMLRIDIDNPALPLNYSSPPSNPFFGAIPGRDEIYALGLRNPFRYSFDSLTGQIYLGDVGLNTREEIDIITLGGNYGWSVYEGTLCTNSQPALCIPANFIPPITEYTHSGGGCAVIGGDVYRGTRGSLPVGSYVYGDNCTGEIFIFENGVSSLLMDTSLSISGFGQDENREIYVVALQGSINRIINPLNASSLEIEMSKTTYGNGDVVTATDFRLKNPGTAPGKVELKVSLIIPGMDPISVLNLGSDGSFQLPAGTNQNLGPLTFFTVSSGFPRSNNYQLNSRMLDPVTGKLVSEDINKFAIQ